MPGYNDINGMGEGGYNDIMGAMGFSFMQAMKNAGKGKNPFSQGKPKKTIRKPNLLPTAYDGGVQQRVAMGTGTATWTGPIAAGVVQRLTVRPQMPFSIRKVIFDVFRNNAAGVGINVIDIQVAQTSIFASGGQLPTGMFTANAVDSSILSVTAQVGQDINIDLVNTAALIALDVVTCTGGFYGDAVSIR
jgi:hypothetical protein